MSGREGVEDEASDVPFGTGERCWMFTRSCRHKRRQELWSSPQVFKSHTRKTARFALTLEPGGIYRPSEPASHVHHLTFTADTRHFALRDRQVGHAGRSTTRVVGVPEGQHSQTAHPRCCGGWAVIELD